MIVGCQPQRCSRRVPLVAVPLTRYVGQHEVIVAGERALWAAAL
ncbi:hypothetical protein [Streptomyces antarcticus]|nr:MULTISPECIES: hypothetical protein [unclassified Streptomyces]MCY0944809.1 hypothetical protein [Streptomyces sp. H34-AA3]MCY0953223.1 hypothetical protein [Streptomyces sp. H27-S2]MCZ4081158.1 hypothetical protein [Streptomyces sp. H34-S5]